MLPQHGADRDLVAVHVSRDAEPGPPSDEGRERPVTAEVRVDGTSLVLVEHHCPICVAAATCQGLCRTELEVFQATLGEDALVEREQHLLSGDQRCAYRITPR